MKRLVSFSGDPPSFSVPPKREIPFKSCLGCDVFSMHVVVPSPLSNCHELESEHLSKLSYSSVWYKRVEDRWPTCTEKAMKPAQIALAGTSTAPHPEGDPGTLQTPP